VIGFLRGRLAVKHPPLLVVDVAGVGYELEAPMSTFYDLPAVGEEVYLLTHLLVRDDAHVLYGFGSEAERRLFRSLLRISGVGAKMALGILSGISVDGFRRCVMAEDSATLVKVPGIGKKTAERLIMEMRDRLDTEQGIGVSGPADAVSSGSAGDEAYDALVALGYKPAEAARMLKTVPREGISTEEMIRQALQGVVKQ
jgi:Holliday junction DNA helicase RuvA